MRIRSRCLDYLSLLLVSLLIQRHGVYSQDAIAPIDAPFPMPQLSRPSFPERRFDIREYGAVEGGQDKNTLAIGKAIGTATRAGGGTVVIPAGRWLTGAIHLDNNVNLYVSKGAELLFSQEFDDYLPVVFSRHEDIECFKFSAFIYADGKTNIAITGEGVLNGQGKPWWQFKDPARNPEPRLQQMAREGIPVSRRVFDGSHDNVLRPAFFQPIRCNNVLVEGVTFLYGAFWTITPTYCENVIVRRVRIVTEGEYGHTPNGDGVDPSSSRNVLIEDCQFDTGDDCIAIKAGRDEDGLRVHMPTENVVIRNCVGYRGHGGIVIGSETAGGIRNVFARDCKFSGNDRIVRIKTARGRGGILEHMWFRNLSGEKIQQEAIHLNMLYTGRRFPAKPVSRTTPRIRDMHFVGIHCTSGQSFGIQLLGLPEMPIENVTFDSLELNSAKGIECMDAKKISFVSGIVRPDRWPVMLLADCDNVTLSSIDFSKEARPFLRVEGARSRRIVLRGIDKDDAMVLLSIGAHASPGAVTLKK